MSEITDASATALPATPLTTEAPGVLLYPEAFETIVAMLRTGITRLAADDPAPFLRLAIPPVISRRTIERAGYVASFPQLLGTVHSYAGDAKRWGSEAAAAFAAESERVAALLERQSPTITRRQAWSA